MSREIKKIVSLLPSSTEIVCALGLKDRLAAITHECDYPSSISGLPAVTASRISHESMSSSEIDHAVRTQLDGHGSIYDLDEKRLSEIDPDLIITQELCDVCAVNYEMVTKAAKVYAAGAKIVSLEPTTIEEIFDSIRTVGDICGVSDTAMSVVNELQERLDKIRKVTVGETKRPNVFMLEWLDPPFAPGHWVPEQVEIAGGVPILGEAGKKSIATTFELIRESNPEIVALIPCGYYIDDIFRQLRSTAFPDYLKDVKAFETGNIWAIDASSYFSRPGPRVVQGTEILAKIVHPELFGEPDESEAVRIKINDISFSAAESV